MENSIIAQYIALLETRNEFEKDFAFHRKLRKRKILRRHLGEITSTSFDLIFESIDNDIAAFRMKYVAPENLALPIWT